MSAQAGSAVPSQKENTNTSDSIADKGKGKATQDVSMGDDESSSEEELDETAEVADEVDEDNMEEIDTDNIITDGRRTRGRQIDFAKAAQELPEEDDDEDDDDDFEAADDDKMEE